MRGTSLHEELDKLLCERYPAIFADRHASIETSSMGWGFCTGDGWFDLIDSLCAQLQDMTTLQEMPQVVATQVKEKFGGLRFYVRGTSKEQRAVISFAQRLSHRICETCGSARWHEDTPCGCPRPQRYPGRQPV